MTEDRAHKVADEPAAAGRQRPERKKRKWDQPAEDLVSAAVTAAAVAGMPVMNFGALPGVALPSVTAYGAATLPSVVPVPYSLPPHIAPSVLQNAAAAAVQKLSQAKIPDEVIAREIVINDADPSVRYKLTKRQTQEEIQRCTNTVIITRGKYHPPNEHPDGEKPLYLHVSAGSQFIGIGGAHTSASPPSLPLPLARTAHPPPTAKHPSPQSLLKLYLVHRPLKDNQETRNNFLFPIVFLFHEGFFSSGGTVSTLFISLFLEKRTHALLQ